MAGRLIGPGTRWALTALAGLGACMGPAGDWRIGVMGEAEGRLREMVQDPKAEFSRVQVTADDRTGQTCGYVSGASADGPRTTMRFIVYIDGTAGPYVEPGLIATPLTTQDFENASQADCVREGYRS